MGESVFEIPTIDLQEIPEQALNERIKEASEKWGCFRLVNHGVPLTLMAEMKLAVRSLLDRPVDVKRRNTDVIMGSGYMGPSSINPLYEALGLYDMASSQAVHTFCDQLEASPEQRKVILEYAKVVHGLAMDLARRLAESYGLKSDVFGGWPSQFRINKYDFKPETVGQPGVQLHTDSGFLTVLQDDENVGGLEVMDRYGVFVPVEPLPGSLLVNLGDMATIWSNGRLCNVKHRVQCKEATERVSIATFLLGPMDTTLEAPPVFVDAQHLRRFVPVSHEELRKIRLTTKLHDGEALELIRADKA